jgi:flagellar hook-associated protein 1 FlgK
MSSPFFGLDIGVSALRAAQQQLDTAAHNVANANTPGYSRQVVTLVEAPAYTYPGFTRSGLPGQIGSGVSVAAITRVRDTFLDGQVQTQMSLQGEWDTRQQELAKIEAVFPEPSDSGLGNSLSKYYSAWQDVAADPSSTAARAALTEQAASLAMDINGDATQLKLVQAGINTQVNQQVTTINSLASQIANLNGQIQRVTVSGSNPNDLLDQREQLLEKLSTIVPTVEMSQPDGTMTVLVGGTDLVSNVSARTMVAQKDSSGNSQPTWSDGSAVVAGAGQLKALLDVRDTDLAGYQTQLNSLAAAVADSTNALHERGVDSNGNPGQAIFTYYAGNAAGTLAVNPAIAANPQLIAAAAAPNAPGDGSVAGLIGDLANARSYSNGIPGTDVVGGTDLTTGTTARLATVDVGSARAQTYTFSSTGPNSLTLTGADGSNQTITVTDMLPGDTQVLNFDQLGIKLTVGAGAAAKSGADIATDLTTTGHNNVVATSLYTPPQTTTEYYAGLVGNLGAASSQASEMAQNQQLVVAQLTSQVSEQSGVSLDEEATNMLQFQHAYQAAARVITTMDQMLDTLINNTGLAGR